VPPGVPLTYPATRRRSRRARQRASRCCRALDELSTQDGELQRLSHLVRRGRVQRSAPDTKALIALLRGGGNPVSRRIREHDPGEIAISSIAMHELYYRAYRSERLAHSLSLVDGLLLEVVDFDRDDAREAGAVLAELAARGAPIGPFDMLMAGQARGRGFTLVAANVSEFLRVDGLAVQDWSGS
jgi:tRNA(fMet)-specific endonuclease VapC